MRPTADGLTHFRCPIHGFVSLEDWQREIVSQPSYQRLRRIRQLGMADLVYPGAVHTRFEHSLGTFQIATELFDSIRLRAGGRIESVYGIGRDDFERARRLVQAAALLHDIGHAPFSHVSEPLLPTAPDGQRHSHEEYSAAVIRGKFADVIDNHPANRDFAISTDEVAAFLLGESLDAATSFWRGLIVGQMDADRMDYLLRDSHHLGVDYGRYDRSRIMITVTAAEIADGGLAIGVEEGGWHAVEAMVLARYAIFTQVYFHQITAIFEHHMVEALKTILPGGCYPALEEDGIDAYLAWDDWRVCGALAVGAGGEDGERIRARRPHAQIYHTPEAPDKEAEDRLVEAEAVLEPWVVTRLTAKKSSWHQPEPYDVPVRVENRTTCMLSDISPPVKGLAPHRQVRLYVRREDREAAAAALAETFSGR